MSCSVVVRGSGFASSDWGIGNNMAGFKATTSVSITERVDKVEGRDSCGKVVAVVYYNKTSEVSIEGIGSNKKAAGSVLNVTGNVAPDQTPVYVDESSVEQSNNDWVKTTIKGTGYENVN